MIADASCSGIACAFRGEMDQPSLVAPAATPGGDWLVRRPSVGCLAVIELSCVGIGSGSQSCNVETEALSSHSLAGPSDKSKRKSGRRRTESLARPLVESLAVHEPA